MNKNRNSDFLRIHQDWIFKHNRFVYKWAILCGKKRCTSIVGWVKRDAGTIYVGFAYLNDPQQFEIETKLANPTGLVADRQLNPTYDLWFRTIVTVEEEQGPFIVLFAVKHFRLLWVKRSEP